MLTLLADICLPNKVRPFVPTWAVICAGPVSFAITKELSFISDVNWEISKLLSLSKIGIAFISIASFNSEGPGAVTTLYSSPNLFKISFIKSL